jgi:hypothetical protein
MLKIYTIGIDTDKYYGETGYMRQIDASLPA